jgi:ABC-type glycerol-3-phosphate transport system permease component
VLMAACTITFIPVLAVFLTAQNAFVKGIVLTGLKD